MQSRWSRPWTFREDEAEDDEKEEKRQAMVAHNQRLQPPKISESGVTPWQVPENHAQECAKYLKENWTRSGRGGLQLCAAGARTSKPFMLTGFNLYNKTLGEFDAIKQPLHTLLVTNDLLPMVRNRLPGFHAIERVLVEWLQQRFGTRVELWEAHGLRQGPETKDSASFSIHQDTEEYPEVLYTVVVKLTPDGPEEPPSAMHIVGHAVDFEYGPQAGACGMFLAGLYHASVAPRSDREHLKMTYFFRHEAAAHEAKKLPEHGLATEGDRSVLAAEGSKSLPRGSRADTQPQRTQTGGWSGREFVSPMGVPILVGRNRAENEQLSLKIARDPDVWFHVRGAPGAHVVLRMSQLPKGSVADDDCMQMAADLAAFYSELRDERKALVAYTSPRHITKPNGAPLGAVRLREEDGTILGRPTDSALIPKSIVELRERETRGGGALSGGNGYS